MRSAVILAAGASSRMNARVPKQLLRFRGKTLLRRAVETALEVPTEQVIVVLGHQADALMPELEGLGVTVVLNQHWAEGISSSLRGGLGAVASESRGVFVYPSDMPFVSAEALRELAGQQQASGRPAAMSEVAGVRGVPVYVTRSLFPGLMILEGDSGGSQYLRAHPDLVEIVHFQDELLMLDVDRPRDYERILAMDPDVDHEADLSLLR